MSPWAQTALLVAAPMFLLWLASVRLRDASIVDRFWGTGFALIAGWLLVSVGRYDARSVLLAAIAGVWGVRLSAYLTWRNWGHGEDRRYQRMRAGHRGYDGRDRFAWRSLGLVFGLQAALIWLVCLPVQWALLHPTALSWVHALGACVAIAGIGIEATADLQLARFKANPASAGQVCTRGLWRYSRHPNYFGDFTVWWGLFALSYSGPTALWTAIGPLVMSILLLRVSGVTLLERDIAERRPAYRDYVRRTSAFIPLPPRSPQGNLA